MEIIINLLYLFGLLIGFVIIYKLLIFIITQLPFIIIGRIIGMFIGIYHFINEKLFFMNEKRIFIKEHKKMGFDEEYIQQLLERQGIN